ncbi:MAG: O-antigen ligase family protein [Blastocatellia bacterium]|nr:O-antigen ligase family protein [Blastocatellia bacterium]
MASTSLALPETIPHTTRWPEWFEAATSFSLLLCIVTAPHSIAAAQGSFVLAVFCWLGQCLLTRKWGLSRNPADIPMLLFLGLCLLSSLLSYEPRLSLDGMRGVAFLGVVYLVAARTRTIGWAVTLALLLVASCQVNCIFTLFQRFEGDGVRVTNFAPHSPFPRAQVLPGDVIQKMDGVPLNSLEDLSKAADTGDPGSFIKLTIRRGEDVLQTEIRRGAITKPINHTGKKKEKNAQEEAAATTLQGVARLGAQEARAHDFRAKGFYNHYATYAEVLQLIASLAIGCWLTVMFSRKTRNVTDQSAETDRREVFPAWVSRHLSWFLSISVVLLVGALWCTMTRALMIGLAVSVSLMLVACWRAGQIPRLLAAGLLAAALAVSIGGVATAYSLRNISLTDTREGSAFWRLVVWQEGMQLIERHPWLGIGKNSDKIHGKEWGLWGNGQLPPGHFHNTYLQVAVWWGLPALCAYLWMMWRLWHTLWRNYVFPHSDAANQTRTAIPYQGVILGTLGGLTGFATSSIVHFNFGDGEVVMVLWLMVGLSLAILRIQGPGSRVWGLGSRV